MHGKILQLQDVASVLAHKSTSAEPSRWLLLCAALPEAWQILMLLEVQKFRIYGSGQRRVRFIFKYAKISVFEGFGSMTHPQTNSTAPDTSHVEGLATSTSKKADPTFLIKKVFYRDEVWARE